MLMTKILFLILIIVCVFFYILYVWNFSLILLVIFIALPVVMFVTTLITKHLTKAEFAVPTKTTPKNTSFPVQLCVTNRSIFPIGKAEAHIEYYNIFNNQINEFELLFPLQARNTQRVTFQLSSKYCGILKIRSAYINIYDPLRIFRFRTGKNITAEIAVMPEIHEVNGSISYTDRESEESSVFSENTAGDDPSEVFDLRDYIIGDKLNRIHWKLSSKKDDLIVKDYSMPVDVPCMLFLNLKCYEDSEYTLPVFDTLVETLISVSQFLIENERIHTVVYYNAKARDFCEVSITSLEVLAETIRNMILSISDSLRCEPPEKYFQINTNISLSSFTFITSVPDTPVLHYIEENIDADIRNAIVIVKSPESASDACAGLAELNTVPVVIGRITSSVRDIEL
ncbi:MAG: DUF58 domain-containing protein [Ruminococcus flavefaciens]|nr:DUF58 domain-containing protein [Ruminococcus flavefaciens]